MLAGEIELATWRLAFSFFWLAWYRHFAAQVREPAPKVAARAPYPRTNLATAYEVVVEWPSQPKDVKWGAVAGIAISPSQQIWTFNRGAVPVQVYTAEGACCARGGRASSASRTRCASTARGSSGWSIAGMHVVQQFTPDGQLLQTLGTPGEPGEDSTHLNRPTDVAVAADGQVFVTDGYGNNRIVHFDDRGHFVRAWGSSRHRSRAVQPAPFDRTRFSGPDLCGGPQQRARAGLRSNRPFPGRMARPARPLAHRRHRAR